MFHSARLKLTANYLLIIMLISFCFSGVIYQMVNSELTRVENMHRLRIEHRLPIPSAPDFNLSPELIAETRNRLKLVLFLINFGVIGFSATAGYYLAGRTLKPISQMMESQKRFVDDASHELKTPLSAMKLQTEVALRNKTLTQNTKTLLQSNLEEIDKLNQLTTYILQLSRYQNTDNLVKKKINLKAVLNHVVTKNELLAKNKKIKIVSKFTNLSLLANQVALEEVFNNLINNAIKYSKPNTEIKISLKKNDYQAEIKIIDQGVGIAKKDLPHIFNRFFRSDQSRSKIDSDGYGLGLTIAKNIIDHHHGQITVSSQINHGSTFTVTLPL